MITAETGTVKMVMWERVEMPHREKNSEGVWVKTGTMDERTKFTFKSEEGDVLKLFGDAKYRELEGHNVVVTMGMPYDSFNDINKLTLYHVEIDD